ncbi:MAG: dihydrofolate reductase [Corynebacteriales bacterium]|nr:dihydrofolate reductase [Mycobacteriales bacterium]
MRKLCYFVAISIDGYIAAPDGTYEDFNPGPEYIALLKEHFPETLPKPALDAFGIDSTVENVRFDTVVSGRNTYEVGAKVGLTDQYPRLRQYVVSSSMSGQPDPAVKLISGNPVAAIRELKKEDGKDIYLCGGATLAQALMSEIDELIVKVNPVVLGSGIPLFSGGYEPRRFEFVEGWSGSDVQIMRYAKVKVS